MSKRAEFRNKIIKYQKKCKDEIDIEKTTNNVINFFEVEKRNMTLTDFERLIILK